MQIIKQDQKTLILERQRIYLSYAFSIIVSVVILLVSGSIAFRTLRNGGDNVLRCGRAESLQVDCELTIPSRLLGDHVTTIVNLQQAEVVEETNAEGFIDYQLFLVSENGRFPTRLKYHQVNLINSYIQNPTDPSFFLQEDSGSGLSIVLMISVMFILSACSGIFSAIFQKQIISCVLDKKKGQFQISYRNLISLSSQREEDLKAVKIAFMEGRDSGMSGMIYSLRLVLDSGEVIDLDTNIQRKEEIERYGKLTQEINHFLEDA